MPFGELGAQGSKPRRIRPRKWDGATADLQAALTFGERNDGNPLNDAADFLWLAAGLFPGWRQANDRYHLAGWL